VQMTLVLEHERIRVDWGHNAPVQRQIGFTRRRLSCAG
jgi:hypothetical protein